MYCPAPQGGPWDQKEVTSKCQAEGTFVKG